MAMDEASDRLLVQRTRGGDVNAFGERVQRYQTSVFSVCYRLLGDSAEAEDLAQEAFLRAFRRLATFDVERSFGPWMRRGGDRKGTRLNSRPNQNSYGAFFC